MADPPSGELVDRNPGADVGAGRFFDTDAGEKCAGGARVVAATILAGVGAQVVEPAEYLNLAFQRFKGLHRAVQLEVLVLALGPPAGLVGAVGEVNEGHS